MQIQHLFYRQKHLFRRQNQSICDRKIKAYATTKFIIVYKVGRKVYLLPTLYYLLVNLSYLSLPMTIFSWSVIYALLWHTTRISDDNHKTFSAPPQKKSQGEVISIERYGTHSYFLQCLYIILNLLDAIFTTFLNSDAENFPNSLQMYDHKYHQ